MPLPTTAQATALPTPADDCALYDPANPLLTLVDRETALPRDFAPTDLITLTLPSRNDWILPLRGHAEIEPPLLDMLDAANQTGLALRVVSAYRSYTEQALAFQKWAEWYPDRANALSAEPGHSEHQLGTAVDFTTPEIQARMPNRFHVDFALTPEGKWLAAHAAGYGFTLSYPEWATEQTGYEWEPWHYRYVGAAVAQLLAAREPPVTLSAFIQQCAAKLR
jgi:D-alanyl-D-alanine carboxypeptidase